MLDMMKFMVLL